MYRLFLCLCGLTFAIKPILLKAQNTITTNTLTQTSFCAGGDLIVQYSSTGNFPFGCLFSAELSDATGNFSNPVTVGSIPINAGVIAGTIPNNTPFGFNYRVRVVANNPVTVGSESSTGLIITSSAISASIFPNPGTSACQGSLITLSTTFNESYDWSTGETSQSIQVSESGYYTVRVTNFLTGCEVTSDPIQITLNPKPVVNLGNDFESCNGQIITLDAGSGFANYAWNNGSTSQSISVGGSGNFWVNVTDNLGCLGGDTITSTYFPLPALNLGPDTTVCGTNYLIAVDTGFAGYNWNSGLSFNPNLLIDSSGEYYLKITDIHGCTNRDTLFITLLPQPIIFLGNDIAVCGTSVTLDAGPSESNYDWNSGQGSSRFFKLDSSGLYSVKVLSADGCVATDTIAVALNSLPQIPINSNYSLTLGDSILLDAGSGFSSYLWDNGSLASSQILNSTDLVMGENEISMSVTDSNGCSSSKVITITLLAGAELYDVSFYPNPFKELLTVQANLNLAFTKPVFIDVLGQLIYPEYTINDTYLSVKRGTLAAGCYLLVFENKSGLNTILKKVVIN